MDRNSLILAVLAVLSLNLFVGITTQNNADSRQRRHFSGAGNFLHYSRVDARTRRRGR